MIIISLIILLQLTIINNRKIRISDDIQQVLLNEECYYGTKQQILNIEYKHQFKFQRVTQQNCRNNITNLWQISQTFKYGNWCGKNYGGFNNECKDYCLQNLYIPSEECIKCNEPIDWVDTQCMYHDFCMTRFESYGIGYGEACSDEINLGNPFPSPCDCAYNLTENLKLNKLIEHCGISVKCHLNGEIIQEFFDNDLLKCSCSYTQCNNNTIDSEGKFVTTGEEIQCWNATACINVEQCAGLNGN